MTLPCCDVCGLQLTTKYTVRRHKAKLHGVTDSNICKKCGTCFMSEANLQKHLRWKHPSPLADVEMSKDPPQEDESSISTIIEPQKETVPSDGATKPTDAGTQSPKLEPPALRGRRRKQQHPKRLQPTNKKELINKSKAKNVRTHAGFVLIFKPDKEIGPLPNQAVIKRLEVVGTGKLVPSDCTKCKIKLFLHR